MKMLLIQHDVAPCGACRPWIFFINGVLCFLNINGSRMKMEERWLEIPLHKEDESRISSPPYEAMEKSLKVGEDEWRERERRSTKFWPQMRSQLWSVILKWSKLKKFIHMASIYSLSVTQNWREIWISIQISLEFEIEFVKPNFGSKI